MLGAIALATVRDRSNPKRVTTALFWALMAGCLVFDDAIASLWGAKVMHRVVGGAVLLMSVVAGLGGIGHGRHAMIDARQRAEQLGHFLFLPTLSIPLVTVVCSLGLKGASIDGVMLFDKQAALASLGVAVFVALGLALWVTKSTPTQAFKEAHRLLDTVGWAAVLPMMLAMLGGIFAAAKTGDSIKILALMFAPEHQRFAIVFLYCVGMAAFTIIMGNAYAAFPVMTVGLALPIMVKQMGANPAALVAIGMCAGYCGTLVTPMAANFNIVPAVLLDLRNRYGVIAAQMPTAITLFFVNLLLMSFLPFL
jgi:uncharacterized membrane protein